MTRLLGCDLDGTIVFDRRVPDDALEALAAWRAAGNLLAISTGKSIFATKDVLGAVDFDYLVCYTGAVITDGTYRVIDSLFLSADVVHEIFADLRQRDGIAVYATTLESDYLLSDRAGKVDPILSKFEPLAEADFDVHEFIGIPMLVPDEPQRDELEAHLRATYGDIVDVHRNQDFLDIVPLGSTKGLGLRRLIDTQLAGEEVELWTLGDSYNDIDMHQIADHAVAFTYSPPEVKAVAERVVERASDLLNDLLRAGDSQDAR